MPYCKNCGHSLPEGTSFCPECGTPVKAAPASAPASAGNPKKSPKSGPKVAILIAVFLVVIALTAAAIVLLPRLLNPGDNPDDSSSRGDRGDRSDQSVEEPDTYDAQFAALHREMLDELLAPLVKAAGAVPDRLSTDLTLSLDLNDPEIQPYLNGSSLTLRVDAQAGSLLMDGELVLMGVPILTGYLTYEDGIAGFCLPEADGVYYTLPAANLLSALTGTPAADVDLSALDGATSGLTARQLENMCQAYLDTLLSMANEENVTYEKREKFELSCREETRTGQVYTCTPKAEEAEAMFLALADQIEKDQELHMLLSSMGNMENQPDQFVQNLRDNAQQYAQNLENNHITWRLCVDDDATVLLLENNGATMCLECFDDGTDATTLFSVNSPNSSARINNSFTRSDGWVSGTFSIWNSKNDNTVGLDYNFEENSSAPFLPYGRYSLESGIQELYLDVEDASNGIGSGDGAQGQTPNLDVGNTSGDVVRYTLTISAPPQADTSYDTIILTIYAAEGGTPQAPSVPPTDISQYSNRQLQSLFNQLGEALSGNLTAAILKAMYGAML